MRQMKYSGIEWIGNIPADWNIRVAFQLFEQVKNKNDGLVEQNLLSLSYGKIKRKNINTVGGLLPENFDGYNIIERDDIVLRLTDLQNDHTSLRVGLSTERGIVTSAYVTLRNQSENIPLYLYYYLHSFDLCKGFYGMGAGVRQGLNWDGLKLLKFALPSVEEQKRIADFLDKKCAEIDAVIAKTKATIEEYKKLKQSIINEAVTKGIRGNLPMKDSGIEWIGEIPAEWNVLRLKNLAIEFSKGNGITKEDVVANGDTPCVRYGEIYTKYNQSFTECQTRTNKANVSTPKYFSYGDLLFTCTGELVEEIGKSIVYMGEDECLAGGDIIVLRHLQCPSFLNYAVNSNYAQAQKSCDKTKLKVVHISSSDIANIIMAIPNVSEQEEIEEYLDKKCIAIDNAIAKKTALLEEMENYKKSVIYEYVTGKREV